MNLVYGIYTKKRVCEVYKKRQPIQTKTDIWTQYFCTLFPNVNHANQRATRLDFIHFCFLYISISFIV